VSAIEELITELARLPGIGRKTAQRLTFHLLQQSSEQAVRLSSALIAVTERVRPCTECGNLTED
jgi:recombination protein RecR